MPPRAARARPRRRRAAAAPPRLPLPCRESRRCGKNAPKSRDEMLLCLRCRGDQAARLGQILLGRVAAKAEPDRRSRLAIVEAERAKHMARPARAAGAGAAEGKGDASKVGEQPSRVDSVAPDVEIAVITVRGAAVDRPARSQRLGCGRPQPLNMVVVAVGPLSSQ